MMRHDGDPDLREIFRVARREVEAQVPLFQEMWGKAARRTRGTRRSSRLAWALASAPLVLALAYLAVRPSPLATLTANDVAAARAIEEWRAPTDFLSEVSGLEILDTMPALGEDSRRLIETLQELKKGGDR